jgi:hypothetical protein
MTRHFNASGLCVPLVHSMLPPERRLPEVRGLVDQMACFIVHAPRQVGKTTALTALARSLTEEGRYAAVLVSMEVGAPHGDDIGAGKRGDEDPVVAKVPRGHGVGVRRRSQRGGKSTIA